MLKFQAVLDQTWRPPKELGHFRFLLSTSITFRQMSSPVVSLVNFPPLQPEKTTDSSKFSDTGTLGLIRNL